MSVLIYMNESNQNYEVTLNRKSQGQGKVAVKEILSRSIHMQCIGTVLITVTE